ncbi:H-NS histone family protein [Pseudoduganella lutea]|uniref:H-NS histone family protein n=2 Tax=Pseudoduganella lutea TaxID=321985 RepID=A0A4V0Z4N4_9BURK|nr:H-NS histone family protein [Pseudoduganella lutea]
MASYQEIKAKIAELERQAEELRRAEREGAIQKIRELMQNHGLSVQDLAGSTKKQPKKDRSPVAAKYRDPKSGATWTGRGRAPLWLNGRSKDDFLIKD